MGGIANPLSVNAIYNEVKSLGFKVSKNTLYDWLYKACGIYLFLEAVVSRYLTGTSYSISPTFGRFTTRVPAFVRDTALSNDTIYQR